MTEAIKKSGRWAHIILGILFLASAAFFIYQGVTLITLGGSWYYALCGVALLALVWGLIANKTYTGPLYAAIFIATVIWAVWESGLNFWGLFPRLFIFIVAGALLAFALPSLRRNAGAKPRTGLHHAIGSVMLLIAIGTFSATFKERGEHISEAPTGQVKVTAETALKNWDNYGANAQGERFAALDQINRTNVANLEVAWTFRHGDIPISPNGVGREDLNTPLQIGNAVFYCSPLNNIISLNATTGKQNWKAEINSKNGSWARCRSIAYYDGTGQQPNRAQAGVTKRADYVPSTDAGACPRRILTSTMDSELIAINADTGAFCADFGTNGRVDLKEGLGSTNAADYRPTSGPALAGDVVVVGAFVNDNIKEDIASGVVRAFDVKTGALRWAWDSGNPAVKGAPTAEVPYSRGSPNVWSLFSYDPETDTVFLPMGNNSPDLWGGNRTPERDKYASSIVALNAADGSVRWHYQTVHHDLWDFDITMQPTLTTYPKDGEQVPAVVFGTKQGMFFVLDRRTGEPLTKVEERPVPQGNLKGERYSPTQPFSVGMPQLGNGDLTEAKMWGMTPFDQLLCRIDFKSTTFHGLFYPPGLDRQLLLPGSLGGFNWGGISVDPTANVIYANDLRFGLRLQLAERKEGEVLPKGVGLPMAGSPYYVKEKTRFNSPLGVPCQQPPFGTMNAIDLKTGKLAWSIPAGTVQDIELFGVKMRLPIPIGMPTIGGSMATQGGLLFFAATPDYYLRAYDSANGKELWKGRLPVGAQSTPITYISPENGEQYVLIAAGGARNSPDRGDYIVAYKLKK